jgi:hypothetical protein
MYTDALADLRSARRAQKAKPRRVVLISAFHTGIPVPSLPGSWSICTLVGQVVRVFDGRSGGIVANFGESALQTLREAVAERPE